MALKPVYEYMWKLNQKHECGTMHKENPPQDEHAMCVWYSPEHGWYQFDK